MTRELYAATEATDTSTDRETEGRENPHCERSKADGVRGGSCGVWVEAAEKWFSSRYRVWGRGIYSRWCDFGFCGFFGVTVGVLGRHVSCCLE